MILVVDDDPRFLIEFERLFRATGQRVLFALNGAHALSLVQADGAEIGLALIDLDLPDISGFELIRDLHERFPTLPVIAFSGVIQDHTLEVARYMGAAATLKKPLTAAWLETAERIERPAA